MSVSDSALCPIWHKPPRFRCGAAQTVSFSPKQAKRSRLALKTDLIGSCEPQSRCLFVDFLGPPAALTHRLPKLVAETPPWLVSLALHLAVVLLLSLWIISPPTVYSPQVLVLTAAEDGVASGVESLPALRLEVTDTSDRQSRFAELISPELVQVASDIPIDPSLLEPAWPVTATSQIDDLFASGGSAMEHLADELAGAEFFGVRAVGSRFVFVVDSSNSMRRGKLDAAKEELLYAIRRLSSDQSFYVIFFSGNTVPMSLDLSGEPSPEPVLATIENIQKLEAWVDTVEVDPWTNPHAAMQQAVRMLPDAIYLLSDGEFTDRGATVRFLKKENYVRDVKGRRPKVIIHTVGFHQRDGEPALKNIARSYGGTYRFVPAPK